MPSPRLAFACVLLGGLLPAAQATIYVQTDDDGAVTLSNVPAGGRFQVLVPGGGADAAPAPRAAGSAARPTPGLRARAARGRSTAFDALIEEVSRLHGLQSALLHAVVSVESGYDPGARSARGAAGLMQLMPQTALRYGVRDAYDARQNLDGGARYLRDLLRLFDDRLDLALAAYNAGEQAVVRHGMRIPPYRETQGYVPRVLETYRRNGGEPASGGADR